ncbi:hypothetical protein BWK60_10740 [Flavobacterium covae]|uniref:pPIWI-associating nuclease domain-containing protein n=1 Tax=Flavobacterium covae TaxID=2906076 RepID=UPI000B4CFB3D|nr:hypothetical protein [Flavobacterium covae]OWP86070.1 hypothetical protein BWK60_10740 [Flavobacterium covae]
MENFEKIKKILTSQFERDLFEASLASLNDKTNKLRYNNFAYSIRELSRHFLHSLSPESKVKNCVWYKTETPDDKPTRAQRIKYAIHGGISNEILQKWGFDLDELKDQVKTLIENINSLSKYTHINPDVFDLKETEIEKNSKRILKSFKMFVETIDAYKKDIQQFLDGHIEEQMIYSVVTTFFENVDSLAPHHTLNYSEVTDYEIIEINDEEIIVEVSGNLHVTLEYGSRKERNEGDGLDLEESFPFETKIKYEISEDFPSDKYEIEDYEIEDYEIEDYDVDVSDWYGDDDYYDEG